MTTRLQFQIRRVAIILGILISSRHAVGAQTPDSTARRSMAAMDTAFAHARQLVMEGKAAAGRQIVDSILTATPPGSPAYGNALYGRAMVAPTAADAERDYQRIIVEYPLSAHAGDALLQLAQLERSRGDRASAIAHLERFLQENPTSTKRGRTGLWLAQLLFEENQDLTACGVLDQARAVTAAGDVELRNQMDFYTARCANALSVVHADSVAKAVAVDSAHADSMRRAEAARRAAEKRLRAKPSKTKADDSASKHAERRPATRGAETPSRSSVTYSVQVGAYTTRAEADRAVVRLRARGLEARVDGARKPFRVRLGHYKTREEADRAAAQFKKAGLGGFVTAVDGR
ncbi:MAG: SPOR domain-containing protein [Gemmatimonadaceae bacterium]